MIRSLHMKMVMIIVLLILSLMTVVGAFLVNSVMAFYLDDFYTRMQSVFEQEALVSDLRTPNEGEEDGGEALMSVLSAYSGQLGLDGRSRKLYILDGAGQYLTGSDGRDGEPPPTLWIWRWLSSGASRTTSSISTTLRTRCLI